MFEPVRGGTRGGQAEFKWSDVSADKDRENYLGHSINAPTGRWQKNKDIHWYNRDQNETDADRANEIKRIKELEADALSVALGFGPTSKTGTTTEVSPSESNTRGDDENARASGDDKEQRLKRKMERREEKRARKERRKAEKRSRRSRSRSRSPVARSRGDRDTTHRQTHTGSNRHYKDRSASSKRHRSKDEEY
ncbi:hypothetical protein BDN72DRAFT_844509 [Pluteus cervinus]|uniref:Uncharacterized protein n=1 Tax=Pluteus cervinus TaxID=181527 RepID=A0ACD3AKJ6_9AGAR|nr:hypothetical protein BDN72DRAFT_844509 [Pluteus cervinus]